MTMPWDRHPDDDDPRPACEHCGRPMVPDAWPSRVWFCEDCDDHLEPEGFGPSLYTAEEMARIKGRPVDSDEDDAVPF